MNAKLVTGRFFMERVLPETGAHLARIQAGRGEHDGIAGGGVLAPRSEGAPRTAATRP